MKAEANTPAYRDPHGGEAAVFLDWAWSRQAQEGRRLFDAWIAEHRPRVATFVVRPDDDKDAADWLIRECERTREGFHGRGHGSLLFVRDGRVVEWVEQVHRSDTAEIDRIYAAWTLTGTLRAGRCGCG